MIKHYKSYNCKVWISLFQQQQQQQQQQLQH
jgi:hypothetical protein